VTPTATPPVDRPVPRGGFGGAGSALILVAGAAVYSGAEATRSLPFDVTPLVVGVIVVVAAVLGASRRTVGTGLVLAGWGSAVLLVDHGVVPGDRTTPVYMLGVGAGLLVAAALAPVDERGAWLTSAAIVAFTGPLAFYLAYDLSWVGRWPVWAIVLLGWGAWDLLWVRRRFVVDGRQYRVTDHTRRFGCPIRFRQQPCRSRMSA